MTVDFLGISIHSLVKRETVVNALSRKIDIISIHSLVKRETRRIYRNLQCRADFNPLPRKEGDVTLHTHWKLHEDFNPLPRKEGDISVWRLAEIER